MNLDSEEGFKSSRHIATQRLGKFSTKIMASKRKRTSESETDTEYDSDNIVPAGHKKAGARKRKAKPKKQEQSEGAQEMENILIKEMHEALGPKGKTIWDEDDVVDTPEALEAEMADPRKVIVEGDELKEVSGGEEEDEEAAPPEFTELVSFESNASEMDKYLLSLQLETDTGVKVRSGEGPVLRDHVKVHLPEGDRRLVHELDAILVREKLVSQQQLATEVSHFLYQ